MANILLGIYVKFITGFNFLLYKHYYFSLKRNACCTCALTETIFCALMCIFNHPIPSVNIKTTPCQFVTPLSHLQQDLSIF